MILIFCEGNKYPIQTEVSTGKMAKSVQPIDGKKNKTHNTQHNYVR